MTRSSLPRCSGTRADDGLCDECGRSLAPRAAHHLDARQAVELYHRGLNTRAIADTFGVSRQAIDKHLSAYPSVVEERQQGRITEDVVAAAWELADECYTMREIADRLGVNADTLTGASGRYPSLRRLPKYLRERRKARNRAREGKRCSVCRIWKYAVEFHKGGGADGRASRCRECAIQATKAWVRNHQFDVTVDAKRCPACQRIRAASEFYRRRASKSGLQTYCKECMGRLAQGESVPEITRSFGRPYKRERQDFGEAAS